VSQQHLQLEPSGQPPREQEGHGNIRCCWKSGESASNCYFEGAPPSFESGGIRRATGRPYLVTMISWPLATRFRRRSKFALICVTLSFISWASIVCCFPIRPPAKTDRFFAIEDYNLLADKTTPMEKIALLVLELTVVFIMVPLLL